MDKENYFARLLILLFATLLAGISLYWLPETIGGYKFKKTDFLSDIRIKPAGLSLDSLMKQFEEQDTIPQIQEKQDSLVCEPIMDSTKLALRDSLYRTVYASKEADSTGVQIEDFSTGRVGLVRFFSALNNIRELERPVRIAFLGDSFIEGDIVVADLRAAFQEQFGGNGVGFVPVYSITDRSSYI